jgi:hypothetical protein
MVLGSKLHTEDSQILEDTEKFRRQSDLASGMCASLNDTIGQILKQKFKGTRKKIKLSVREDLLSYYKMEMGEKEKNVCTAVLRRQE